MMSHLCTSKSSRKSKLQLIVLKLILSKKSKELKSPEKIEQKQFKAR